VKRGPLLGSVVMVAACAPGADVDADAASYRLSPSESRTVVELPARTTPVVALAVDRIVNPQGHAFTLVVLPSGPAAEGTDDSRVLARVTPFPADRGGCFAVRVDPSISRVALQLEPVGGGALPELVEVRITALADC
jgi:hypothetical protein